MRFAIWGAGSVGLGLATTLATPEAPALLIGRDPETLKAIRSEGLRRTGLFGEQAISPDALQLEIDPESLLAEEPDWLLVCTKAFASGAIAEALEPIAAQLTQSTRLVLCQNGWGNEAPFLPFWPKERLFHARVITGFHRRERHVVEITAHASPIALGNVFGKEVHSLASLASEISGGGIPTEVSADMRAVLWEKMLYNCALNPLGALAGRRYGELTANPTTCALVESVIREIFDVLRAAEIDVPYCDADAYLAKFHAELIPPTAQHESSMLQDLRAGRPTEIEALCGAVEEVAHRVGIETPVVSSLAMLVRAAEAKN